MLSLRGDWDVYSSLPPFLGDFRPALPSLTTLEFDLVGDVEVYSSFVQCIRLVHRLCSFDFESMRLHILVSL